MTLLKSPLIIGKQCAALKFKGKNSLHANFHMLPLYLTLFLKAFVAF
jgi:hypothetical protein